MIGKLADKQFAKHFSSFSIHDSESKASEALVFKYLNSAKYFK
jgi:hypothetical protein